MKNRYKKILFSLVFVSLLLTYVLLPNTFNHSSLSVFEKRIESFEKKFESFVRVYNITIFQETNFSYPSLVNYYCNFPINMSSSHSDEGQCSSGWTLKQVHVILRHGDRTPLNFGFYKSHHTVPNFCNNVKNKTMKDMETLQQFRDILRSSRFNFNRYISQQPCLQSQMTNYGMLQHIKNGLLFQKVYLKKFGFATMEEMIKSIKIFSTKYSRTYFSALAFLYGLAPGALLKKVHVNLVSSLAFCQKNCFCPKNEKVFDPLISKKKYKVYLERQRFNKTLKSIASTLRMSDRTATQIDILVHGYYCKGLDIPCNQSGKCVNQRDLDIVMMEQEHMMKILVEESAMRDHSLLQMQPFLVEASKAMNFSILGSVGTSKFLLYSGHDKTVKPLLYALNIPDYRWPRLASRFVIELWEYDRKYYVKMIYNGKDVTNQVSFCKMSTDPHGCLYDDFDYFAKFGIIAHFNAKSRKEACAVS